MMYPHWLTVQEPGSGGTRDPGTGRWVPAPAGLVYDGPADVQDMGAVLKRDTQGVPTETSDAKAFVPNRRALAEMRAGQTAKVRWEDGSLDDAEIVETRRLDTVAFLRFL